MIIDDLVGLIADHVEGETPVSLRMSKDVQMAIAEEAGVDMGGMNQGGVIFEFCGLPVSEVEGAEGVVRLVAADMNGLNEYHGHVL